LCGLNSEFLDVQASGIAYAENTVFQRVNFLQGLVLYDLFFFGANSRTGKEERNEAFR
jgi:hypothetical protein